MSDHVLDVRPTAIKALANGGEQAGVTHFKWDVSGRCQSPVYIDRVGRPFRAISKLYDSGYYNGMVPKMVQSRFSSSMIHVEIKAKCRKCPSCLRDRAREWARRAFSEIRASGRTWFATFTLKPEEHQRFLNVARVKMHRQGIDLDVLPEPERFRLLDAEIQREFTLMFKRMRNDRLRFRYILVGEAHKSGLPHYHALIHELGETITYRSLQARWRFGFSTFKLVTQRSGHHWALSQHPGDPGVAWYVCKYLAKSNVARVRASLRYGIEPELETTPSRHKSVGPGEGVGAPSPGPQTVEQFPFSPREGIDHQKLNLKIIGTVQQETEDGLSNAGLQDIGCEAPRRGLSDLRGADTLAALPADREQGDCPAGVPSEFASASDWPSITDKDRFTGPFGSAEDPPF